MIKRILFAALLSAALINAQRGGGGGRGGSKGPDMPMGSFTASRLDRISTMLNLNKDQKKDFKAAMDEGQKQATPVHEEILKTRQQIADAVAGGKSSEELVKNEGLLEAQLAEIEMRAFAKVAETLEEDQKPRAGMLFQMMRGIFNKKNWNTAENQ